MQEARGAADAWLIPKEFVSPENSCKLKQTIAISDTGRKYFLNFLLCFELNASNIA